MFSLVKTLFEKVRELFLPVSHLQVSEVVLQQTLQRFQGRLVQEEKKTSFHKIMFPLYTNRDIVPDPRIQNTSQIDITALYQNYQENYQQTKGATFTSFVKWLTIKAMQGTPFNWRYINKKWYQFDNLPLEVAQRTLENKEIRLFTLENVNKMSWQAFCDVHVKLKNGELNNQFNLGEMPTHFIAYQIVGLHIKHMTSYNTTARAAYTHQPWIVFSDRYEQNESLFMPFYMSYSHASTNPEEQELFIERFLALGKMKPNEDEKLNSTHEKSNMLSLTQNNVVLHQAKKKPRRTEAEKLSDSWSLQRENRSRIS